MVGYSLDPEATSYEPLPVGRSDPYTSRGIGHARIDIKAWTSSLLAEVEYLKEHNWVDQPFQKRDNPREWITTKTPSDIALFSNVVVGLLFQRPDLNMHRKLMTLAKKPLHEVWAALWLATMRAEQDRGWISHWDEVLGICAQVFDGYPVEAFLIRVPLRLDCNWDCHINWNIPYRSILSMDNCRVDGWNATYTGLRIWNLESTKCLVTNSTWTGVNLTRCKFERCSFRNTKFTNVHFLDCHFADVDFEGVEIENTFISNTGMYDTTVRSTSLSSVSWSHNLFVGCAMESVVLARTIWTYIQYKDMKIENCVGEDTSEHRVRMGDGDMNVEQDSDLILKSIYSRIESPNGLSMP